MALTIILYQHNKRLNSTATPPEGCLRAEFEGVMIDGANVLNPRVAIRLPFATSTPCIYNYAYILSFSARYYYIDNWVFDGGRWVAEMSVDVLASYKEAIGNSVQYVLRSATKKNNTLSDGLYPATALTTTEKSYMTLREFSPWAVGGNIKNGHFIMGIINNDENAVGSVSYYTFTHAQMKKFLQVLMGEFSWLNIGDISEELSQALFNPFQYVVSCMWYPVTPPASATISALPYGWWTLPGVTAGQLSSARYSAVVASFTIPEHPQYDGSGDLYLNANPFTTCKAIIEPWGSFDVPVDCTRGELSVRLNVDFITGRGVLSIENPAGAEIVYRDGALGVPVQLSQMVTDPRNAVSTLAGSSVATAKSVLSGNLGGAISNAVSGVLSTMEAAIPSLETSGANGCFMSFDLTPRIIARFSERVGVDNERFGSPYAKSDLISNHHGYVMCANPSVVLIDAMQSETESVNRYLAEGFFYE